MMATTIAISNQKGGVGKTTSSMNIAACMARMGSKVLAVDLDPQQNLSKAWGVDKSRGNIYSLLLRDVRHKEAIQVLASEGELQQGGALHILPGSSNFSRYEKLRAGEVNAQFDLKKVLEPITDRYDYILLDCPPALGLISINAFSCAHQVLVPMEAQLFAIEGLESILNTIEKVREHLNPGLNWLGVFLIRHNKRNILNQGVVKFIEDRYAGKLLQTSIRENISLREAPHAGKDIFSYAPESNGAQDYQSLTQEILNRLCEKK